MIRFLLLCSILLGTMGFNGATGIGGFTARLGTFQSKDTWTESYLSQLNAGNDVILSSGRDVNLLGGTQIDAGHDIILAPTRDLNIAANKDWTTHKSSSAGISGGVSGGGITVGADGASAKSNGETYTNARLTAGNSVVIGSGRDTSIAGANIEAPHVMMDVGRNLTVASVQNQFHSENKSASGSITISPAGVPTGGSFAAASGNANRSFTDDVTSIIGTESVDINVSGNTHVKGAVIANVENGVDKGNLHLSTGTLTFEDLYDSDKSQQKSVSASYNKGGTDAQGKTTGAIPGVASGSYSSSNTQGVTHATVGNGTIEIRDPEEQEQDVADLNRDVNNVQEITKDEEKTYSIAVPITTKENLKAGAKEIKTASVNVAVEVKGMAAHGVEVVEESLQSVVSSIVNSLDDPSEASRVELVYESGDGLVKIYNGDGVVIKEEKLVVQACALAPPACAAAIGSVLEGAGTALTVVAVALGLSKDTAESDAQAPGVPSEEDGFVPPKNWDGKKVKNPNGPGYGYQDKKGNVWVPTGPGGSAHGGAHWDVQKSGGGYVNVYPGGKTRGGK